MKRTFDFVASFLGLVLFFPVLIPVIVLVWLQDYSSPFYVSARVGKNGRVFRMVKIRSMVTGADLTGVDSTSSNDNRITPLGHFIRRYKFDEIMQLWNVLKGEMSLVGPRPNVVREVNLYSEDEKQLLLVRPGITDISSIVFSDEGDILSDFDDPDIAYHQLIRPWKSRLGIFYVNNQCFVLDVQLIFLTLISVFYKRFSLKCLASIVERLDPSNNELIKLVLREEKLKPSSPPGASGILITREVS